MEVLSQSVVQTFNSALQKLTGYSRRALAAEICIEFYEGSATKMERHLKVGREMIKLGLEEQRSGIRCVEAYNFRGAKKKKTNIREDIQIDPQLKTEKCYVRITAQHIREELIMKKI